MSQEELVNAVRELTSTVQSLQQQQHQTLQQQRANDLQTITQLQSQLLQVATKQKKVSLVDTKGIGRPATFNSDTKNFKGWAFKLGNFLEGI
eukprot:1965301-Amphidinium_carterae.1